MKRAYISFELSEPSKDHRFTMTQEQWLAKQALDYKLAQNIVISPDTQVTEPLTTSAQEEEIDQTDEEKEINWRGYSACSGMDPDIFFPSTLLEGLGRRKELEAIAKMTCATCIVRVDCLSEAMDRNEEYGIWGGLNETERKKLKNEWKKQRRIISIRSRQQSS